MPMRYRRLGRTGLQVSEISLGTVELGMDYGIPVDGNHLRPSEAEAAHLLNRALDLGINFIDTARAYGSSEEVIGRAISARRSEYVLASKVAHFQQEGLTGAELRRRVEASLAESLQRLKTDVIDLFYIHSAPLEVITRGELIEILLDAKRRGMIRFTGATTYGEEPALAALEDGRYDCLQVAYNPIDRLLEERVLPLAQAKDVGIVVRSVLQRGAISQRYRQMPPHLAELKAAIAQLDALCGPDVASLPEMAFRFVLAHPAVASALVGTARLTELEETVAYPQRGPLPAPVLAAIKEVHLKDRDQLMLPGWSA